MYNLYAVEEAGGHAVQEMQAEAVPRRVGSKGSCPRNDRYTPTHPDRTRR